MLRKKSVKRNAVFNVIRQLCNTLMPMVTFAYATRVLQVENYGRINFCSSNVSYFLLIAGLGINTYAVREAPAIRGSAEKIRRFASQIFSINLLSTVAAYILLAAALIIWSPGKEYFSLVMIYSASIILTTIGVEWFFPIYEDYFYITVRTIAVHVIQIVLVFLLVKDPEDTNTYAMIMVGTVGALQILNFFLAHRRIPFGLTRQMELAKHFRTILLLFANNVLVVIYMHSDISMLGFMRGDADVGIYKAAVNLYLAVKSLLNAIYIVTIPRLSFYLSNNKKDEFKNLVNQVLETLITLIFPALIGLFFMSKNVILLVSGESYLESVKSLQILSISLLFASIGGFLVNGILIVNKKDKAVIRATMISASVNIVLNILLIPRIGSTGAAITTLIAEALVAVIAYIYVRRLVMFRLSKRTMLSVFLGCVGIVMICMVCNSFIDELLLSTLTAVLGSVLFYGIIQLLLRPDFVKSFLRRS